MTQENSIPKWILVVSGIFALLEIIVSITLVFSPQSALEKVDLTAKGVDYVIYMWAARQAAFGLTFAYATIKNSSAMLTTVYVFFLLMMVGDLLIGIKQGESALMISAVVMCVICSVMLYFINRKNNRSDGIHSSP